MDQNSLLERTITISIKYIALLSITLLFVGGVLGYSLALSTKENTAVSKPIIKEALATKEKDSLNKDEVEKDEVCVDVSGAVNSPGVYCFEAGSLVNEAISKAGEVKVDLFAKKFVRRYMNFSKELVEGEKIYIPFNEEVFCEAISFNPETIKALDMNNEDPIDILMGKEIPKVENEKQEGRDCINLNSASLADLVGIPGIGESTAQKIMDERPYSSKEELLEINGIGQSKYDALVDLVCI